MKECKESHCSAEIQRPISLCEDVLCAEICASHGNTESIFVIFLPDTETSIKRVCNLLGQSVVLKLRAQLVMPFLANKLTVLLLCFQCYTQSPSAAR